jgi:hypothetical protein
MNWIDPLGLAGETKQVPGTTTTVRIDNPVQPNQQTHAHINQKGKPEIVINKDGTGSHGKDPSKLKNKKVLSYLAKKGFRVVFKCTAPIFFIYDWHQEGFGEAVNELTWPVSEIWKEN